MGEEEKKPEEKKMEEKKKEEAKKVDGEKKAEEKEKSSEEKKTEESKDSKEAPPPPPPEIVLKVFMHCEGCARKIRRSLKDFEGVEDVHTDCRTQKVVVKGEKADPLKVLERVQRKSHRHVELLSPIPKPPAEDAKKVEEKPKAEEKKEEPQVITVVVKVHMHCEACAQDIKKRIQRMKGVEEAEPDLKSSQVTVKGVFDPAKLVEYVNKRGGKHATIVKQEAEKKEEDKEGKEGKEGEKKGDDNKEKKGEEENKDKKDGVEAEAVAVAVKAEEGDEETKVLDMRRNEFLHYPYPSVYALQDFYHQHPPQMFSDENPNACSVM